MNAEYLRLQELPDLGRWPLVEGSQSNFHVFASTWAAPYGKESVFLILRVKSNGICQRLAGQMLVWQATRNASLKCLFEGPGSPAAIPLKQIKNLDCEAVVRYEHNESRKQEEVKNNNKTMSLRVLVKRLRVCVPEFRSR